MTLKTLIKYVGLIATAFFMITVFLLELYRLLWIFDKLPTGSDNNIIEMFQIFGMTMAISVMSAVILISELFIIRIFYKEEYTNFMSLFKHRT